MNIIKYVFWNTEQVRIRTGYRILLQILFFILIAKGLQSLIGNLFPDIKFSSSAPLWFFLAFAGVKLSSGVISVWVVGKFIDRRSFTDFGFLINKQWWIECVIGMGIGIILICVIFSAEYALGWIKINDVFYVLDSENFFIIPLLVCIIVFISVSISEEIVTRGYLLTNLAEGFNFKFIGPRGAIIIGWFISSAVFGFIHIDNPNATFLSTINIVIGGLFLGLGYIVTNRLALPIGIHLTWNFVQANVFGFPVSGITVPSEVVTIIKVDQLGPDLWTGGAFGPEAGLLGLSAILCGSVLIFGWLRFRNGRIGFQLSLASPPNKISKI